MHTHIHTNVSKHTTERRDVSRNNIFQKKLKFHLLYFHKSKFLQKIGLKMAEKKVTDKQTNIHFPIYISRDDP